MSVTEVPFYDRELVGVPTPLGSQTFSATTLIDWLDLSSCGKGSSLVERYAGLWKKCVTANCTESAGMINNLLKRVSSLVPCGECPRDQYFFLVISSAGGPNTLISTILNGDGGSEDCYVRLHQLMCWTMHSSPSYNRSR